MPAYRFYDPAPVFFDTLGVDKVVNGTLTFYDIGTTNKRDTWSDADLTVLNTNPVLLDSAGRPAVNIFLDGDYTVKIEGDNLDPITRDIVSGQSAGQTIPSLETGEFLTNDGSNLLWAVIRQMPDPTGSTGQVPVSNGAGYTLQNLPEAPELDVVVSANSLRVGNGESTTKALQQWGTDIAPSAAGIDNTTKAVVFGTAFATTPVVMVLPTSHSQPGGPVVVELTAVSPAGFTARFDVAEGNEADPGIVNTIPFNWFAIGTVVVA